MRGNLRPAQYYYSALLVMACCWGLFMLDNDMHHWSDLLQTGNLIALALYFFPTYLHCLLLNWFLQRRNTSGSFAIAHSLGIPIGFLMVIVVLGLALGRI